MEARSDSVVQIVRSLCVEQGAIDKPNHLTADSLRSFPQDNWSLTASSGKTNDWRNREHVVLDLFSDFNMGNIQLLLSVNLWGT